MSYGQSDDLNQRIDSKIGLSKQKLSVKLDDADDKLVSVHRDVANEISSIGGAIDTMNDRLDKLNTALDNGLTKLEKRLS